MKANPSPFLTVFIGVLSTLISFPLSLRGQEAEEDAIEENAIEFDLQDIEVELDQLIKLRGLMAGEWEQDAEDGDLQFGELQFAQPGMAVLGQLRLGSVAPSFPSASIKTDSDSEALLQRADEFADTGRYDLASVLWQRVIDQSGDVLLEREEWKERTLQNEYQRFRPMIGEIEGSLGGLDEGGLEAYRLKVDGEARALMVRSKPADRESALAEVIQRYFLSSLGDDAAFELACIKMERREFLPAVRLLTKILNEFPDENISDAEIKSRLAGAFARVGSWNHALELVGNLKEAHPASISKWERIEADVREVMAAQSGGLAEGTSLDATTPSLLMDALPHDRLPSSLKIAWEQPFELSLPESWPTIPESPRSPMPQVQRQNLNTLRRTQAANEVNEPTVQERWKESKWMPVGQVMSRKGLLYFKTDDRLVCCHADTGELEWLGFRNAFPLDDSTLNVGRRFYGGNTPQNPAPQTAEEYFFFGDTVHQSMTLTGNSILSLHGEPLDLLQLGREDAEVEEAVRRFGVAADEHSRVRENQLVAFDRVTGKLKWMREAGESADLAGRREASFSRAPLAYGSILIAPVHEEASLWLCGMHAETGETVWRTFLCDEPANYCRGQSAIGLAVNAGEVYVGSGAGFVFSVDAVSGSLNWAVSYPRTGKLRDYRDPGPISLSRHPADALDGWQQDMVMPYGNVLVVAPSDFNHVFAVDRRSGSLVWESPKRPLREESPAEYLLGLHDGRVIVAGTGVVRAYDVLGGKFLWSTPLPSPSFGRGALTPQAVYVPLANKILQLDPATGTVVAEATVPSKPDEPVGNLFSDGARLIVHGLGRVYALESDVPKAQVPAADDPKDTDTKGEPRAPSQSS